MIKHNRSSYTFHLVRRNEEDVQALFKYLHGQERQTGSKSVIDFNEIPELKLLPVLNLDYL